MADITAPVRTEAGLVQGVTEKGVTAFRGIPFAAPPIGALRWKDPQTPASWQGVRQTTEFAPDPFQGDGRQGNVSEDCLYLNVWVPQTDSQEPLPVLAWIYGGGFSFGSTSTPVHNGEHLSRKGVILVSINYRVGSLGFLAHPELSAEVPSGVSGNYGLKDQIAGLEWIQNNIAAFGGDPDKVTIFGESAGGISVSMLCASLEAKGLFRGAISQSGGSFGPSRPTTFPGENMRTLEMAEQSGQQYMKNAGAETLAELRQLPPEKLPDAWGSGTSWPVVDGQVIMGDQHLLYQNGNYNDVDILVGYNSDEGLSFSRENSAEEWTSNVEARYGPFAEELIDAYPPLGDKVGKTARDLMRDAAFGWPTWSWATLQARSENAKVFYYYFDQHMDHPEGSDAADHGMPHGVDVPYVFQTLDPNDKNLGEDDFRISEIVSTYWTNFAKSGDPNGPGVPSWPEYTLDNRKLMYFNDEAFVGPVPSAASLEVLDDYFEWRRTPEGKSWAK